MMITESDYKKCIRENGIMNELHNSITRLLDSVGIFYRIWIRVKSYNSLKNKITNRVLEKGEGYKIQDLIGVRIVCYFNDDISIVEELLKKNYVEKDKDSTIDEFDADTFKPTRRNYIYELPDYVMHNIDGNLWNYHFDKTFEIQVRTIFAEGWHEVEHDLRYKNKECWDNYKELSRHLNGILATLETCDWALTKVFYDLSYQNYKNEEWVHMLKNKLRIRLVKDVPSANLNDLLKNNKDEIFKKLFTLDRNKLLSFFAHSQVPINIDNIIYAANHLFLLNSEIALLTPNIIKEKLEEFKV